ncbi:hypothetical protein [Lentzea sp. NBRC 102530]|uniref:hypothetical protein n=1 Tax=Lentzea sp. NBRC 102530 TaxID=3032201 RepID=UPI002553F96E|nr:hypothetical protein [Lentzea sp. NBRC 102530]
MPRDIVFFLAPDDESAAATRDRHPTPEFQGLEFHNFDPDMAVVEWARHLEAPGRPFTGDEQKTRGEWPRYVAEYRNDGIGVFVMPDKLRAALANATRDELLGVAQRWGEFLVEIDEDELTAGERLEVVHGVATLAEDELGLYCWVW